MTEAWGPSTWTALHFVALGCPEQPGADQRRAYRDFFAALGPVLPCERCSRHWAEASAALPVDAFSGSRAALFGWVVQMHNFVNARNGKPEWDARDAWRVYAEGARPPVYHTGGRCGVATLAAALAAALILGGVLLWLAARCP